MTDLPTSKFRTVGREEFYTRKEDAERLYAEVINRYGTDFDFFIEPSCGMGAFLNLMPENKIGIDIIFGTDFFTWEFPKGRNIVIGNPPFGRKGKLAMQFLNRCSTHCEVVAMILPSIFSKYTFINRVHPMMHLKYGISAVLSILIWTTSAMAWGQNGHRIVGRIAENHLTPEARQAVAELIGPESLAQVST